MLLAGIYIILAGLYIITSSLTFGRLSPGPQELAAIEVLKGLIFVGTTGIALYFGSVYLLRRIARQNIEIERQRASILILDQRVSAGLLASAIGHDANNMLATVKLTLDMMSRIKDEAQRAEMLAKVNGVLEELVNLNHRLVRGGESEQPGELINYCLHKEVERALSFLDQAHPVRKLKIEYTGAKNVSAEVNRHLFAQVILNLLSNVARHAGENAHTEVEFREEGDTVHVEVHDNGPGIPEDEKEKVFEPYYTSHPEGAGIGLASIRAIMKLHRGEVDCKASKLGGACFSLRFPKNHIVGNSATAA